MEAPARSAVHSECCEDAEVVMADYGTLLRDHVTLKCRSIDRIFLQAYLPKLQSVGQVCTFLRWRRKFKIPSSAAFGKIGEEFVKAVHQFAKENKVPVVHFEKGTKQGETGSSVYRSCGASGEGSDGVGRHRSGEGVSVALVESEGSTAG